MLLNTQPDIEVIGQAVDGVDAVARVAELAPDVVLMDIRMGRRVRVPAQGRLGRSARRGGPGGGGR